MADAVSAGAVSADAVSADYATRGTQFQYSAVIIEPRHHAALAFVLNNIVTHLPATWQIIVLHGLLNRKFVTDIISNIVAAAPEHANRFTQYALPCNNLTISGYNLLLGSRALYELIPTETFLIFQTDTMIFAEHAGLLDEFLEFDYVGAPWGDDNVGNGGFSLRKKSVMLKALANYMFSVNVHEDGYFANHTLNRPSGKQARRFSIETVFSEVTFACHKPWGHMSPELVFSTYPAARELSELQRLVEAPPGSAPEHSQLLEAANGTLNSTNSLTISMCAQVCLSAACLSASAAPALALGLLLGVPARRSLTIPEGCPVPPGIGDALTVRVADTQIQEHELAVVIGLEELSRLDEMRPTRFLVVCCTVDDFRPSLSCAIELRQSWVIVQCFYPDGPIVLEHI